MRMREMWGRVSVRSLSQSATTGPATLATTKRKAILSFVASEGAPVVAALATLTLVGLLIRLLTIAGSPYWFDEAITVGLVHLHLGSMLARIPHSELTPPLYYVGAWVWTHLLPGVLAPRVRLISILCGTATIPVAYLAARTLATRRIGFVVAAVVTFNPLLVWYSREARAYALLVLLCGVSLLFFCQAIRQPRKRTLWLWALASALALATHYFAAFVVLPQAIWLLVRYGIRRQVVPAVAGVGAVAVLLLPLALYQRSHASWISQGTDLIGRMSGLWREFLLANDAQYLPGVGLAVTAACLAAMGLALAVVSTERQADDNRPWGGERAAMRVGLVITVVSLAVPLAMAALGLDYILSRNLIALVVPAALVIGAGFGARQAGWFGLGAAVCLCLVSATAIGFQAFARPLAGVAAPQEFKRTDWHYVAQQLGTVATGRAVVVEHLGSLPLSLYRPGLRTMPKQGAAVGEIDVLTTQPTAPPTVSPVPGFSLVETRGIGQGMTLVRFGSPKPVAISAAGLLGVDLSTLQRLALFEPGGARYSSKPTPMELGACGAPSGGFGRFSVRTPCWDSYIAG